MPAKQALCGERLGVVLGGVQHLGQWVLTLVILIATSGKTRIFGEFFEATVRNI